MQSGDERTVRVTVRQVGCQSRVVGGRHTIQTTAYRTGLIVNSYMHCALAKLVRHPALNRKMSRFESLRRSQVLVAQWLVHSSDKREVDGSSPSESTNGAVFR